MYFTYSLAISFSAHNWKARRSVRNPPSHEQSNCSSGTLGSLHTINIQVASEQTTPFSKKKKKIQK